MSKIVGSDKAAEYSETEKKQFVAKLCLFLQNRKF